MGARRLVAVLGIAMALLLGARRVAEAHAVLVSAEPAAGSRLAASPTRVRLVFSEPLEPALARLSLVAAGGGGTPLAARGDPHDVHALLAPVDSLAPGAYRVVWRVVSADGHPVEGSYVFTVGAPAGAAAAPPPDVHAEEEMPAAWGPQALGAPIVPALLRGAALGALMALTGVLGFLAWPRPGEAVPRRAARLSTVLAAVAAPLLVAHAAAWLLTASPDHRLTGDALQAAASGGAGRVELWRCGLALLALWALGLARQPRLALLFAAGALLASGAAGHPAAITPALAVPAKALHLLAGAAWLGGLLWLLALAPAAREPGGVLVREAGRVSAVALAAVVVVTASGVAQTVLFLPSPRDLVRSAYGALVLAKGVGLLALAGFGAYHRYRLLPRLAHASVSPRFPVMLRREVTVMVLVILLGGVLAYVPPPGPAYGAPNAHSPATHTSPP